jgi:hypothetical protein
MDMVRVWGVGVGDESQRGGGDLAAARAAEIMAAGRDQKEQQHTFHTQRLPPSPQPPKTWKCRMSWTDPEVGMPSGQRGRMTYTQNGSPAWGEGGGRFGWLVLQRC